MNRSTTTAPTRASSGRSWAVLLLLAGCSTYGPGDLRPGMKEGDALARLGAPTDRMALPGGGSRLDYARGPYGPETYRVQLDASGTVTSVGQLLTEANFETVRPGMTGAEVRDRLGRPSELRGGWRGEGQVWSYRYRWVNLCRWFQVWMVDDRVREAGYGIDPLCDEPKRAND